MKSEITSSGFNEKRFNANFAAIEREAWWRNYGWKIFLPMAIGALGVISFLVAYPEIVNSFGR